MLEGRLTQSRGLVQRLDRLAGVPVDALLKSCFVVLLVPGLIDGFQRLERISRRLALTSGILAAPSLSSIILMGVAFSIFTMMAEAEYQPYLSSHLGGFSRALNWLVLTFFFLRVVRAVLWVRVYQKDTFYFYSFELF